MLDAVGTGDVLKFHQRAERNHLADGIARLKAGNVACGAAEARIGLDERVPDAPEVIEIDSRCFPAVELVTESLGGTVSVEPIPVPSDCSDGFVEAYWARPEAFLDDEIRAAQATWRSLPPGVESRAISRLAADLADGRWDKRHGRLRGQSSYDAGLVLIVSRPA